MTRSTATRSRLFAPLVHLAALVLLLEEWFWEAGMRLASRIGRWPPLRWLEQRVSSLRPYPALCVFVLPGLLLFPVKVLALVAIAHGHAATGIAAIVVAKLGGAAIVARVYVLTLPTLRGLAWFERWHDRFVAAKDRLLARLRASPAFLGARRLANGMRRGARRIWRRLRPSARFGSRHASPTARIVRRLVAMWRARRRQSKETGQE